MTDAHPDEAHGGSDGLWRWLVGGLCLGVAVCVAFSRLYLGVHWPTDVLAGMIIATFWVTACLSAKRWVLERRNRRVSAVTR